MMEYKCVIFSVEKKFNLNGPDIWNGYSHDRLWLARRNNKQRSVMVRAVISSQRCTDAAFLSCEHDAQSNISLHRTRIFHFWHRINKGNRSFFSMITLWFTFRISPEVGFFLKISNCSTHHCETQASIKLRILWVCLYDRLILMQQHTIRDMSW